MSEATNIDGAAEKISGLLNPKDQQETETKAEPSEPVSTETQETPESQAESEAAPVEQETENTEVTEETQTESQEPNLHRLKVNGQEIEVSLDELKAGYSRDSDYRQKTHSLGMEKRDLESQKNSLRQSYDAKLTELNELIATADATVRQQQGSADLQKLYEEDPTQAAKLDYQLRQQNRAIEDMKSKAREAQIKQYNEFLETQKELAATKIPEYSDPSKADHRFLMVAKDAMSYQTLKDKRPIVQKKVANAPKVVKPGVAKSTTSSGREQIRNKIGKLRKTGNINDASSAILDIINLKSQQRK